MNLHNMLYLAPDEPVPGGEAAPAAVPQAPAAPEAQQPNEASSPWANDLSQAFPDEAVRGQVDHFLKTTVQPYVTRREQELGEIGNVWNQLWDDNETFPTYLELANQLYGQDVATKLAQTLAEHYEAQGLEPEAAAAQAVSDVGNQAAVDAGQQPAVAQPTEPPSYEDWLKTVPPEFRQYVTEQMEQREDNTYKNQVDAQAGVEPTINANRELYSRYVASMEGDLAAATALWQAEMAPLIKENPEVFGFVDPAAKAAEDAAAVAAEAKKPAREAPGVLGTGGPAGGPTPPQIPAHQTMEEATHDFFKDIQKLSKGTPAGSV